MQAFISYLQGLAEGENGRGLSSNQIPEVINRLNNTQYDPAVFQHEDTCKICLCEYEKDDMVTRLKCDRRHYFHTECIEGWIKQGKNTCPFCNKPIEDIDNIRAAMMAEGGRMEGVESSNGSSSLRRRRNNAMNRRLRMNEQQNQGHLPEHNSLLGSSEGESNKSITSEE